VKTMRIESVACLVKSCSQKAVDCQSCPRINGRAKLGCPRINGRSFTHKWSHYYIEPVLPVINTPVVRATPVGDKSSTCPPNGLHLLLIAL